MDTRGQRRVKSLLLMYLVVVKAAGDCPKPEGGTNTVLTNESLLMNDFPENVEITLECSNGYVKESGSEVITCIDNKWTKSDLVCKEKDCGQPPPQPHMKFDTSSGTLFGAVVKVTCDKGYQIIGSSYKHCFPSGWSGRAKCEIVICDTPPVIADGTRRWDTEDPEFETNVYYSCNEGYSLIGNDIIVCTDTGEYNADPPECKEVRTTVPAPTSQSQVAWTTTAPTSSAAPAVHGAKTSTASATTTILSTLPPDFRGSLTTEEKAATPTVTSATSSSFQDMDDGAVDTGKHIIVAVAVSAAVLIGLIILCCLWHRFNLRRKGSNGIGPI